MFKKLDFKRLNYGDLERIDSHDIKRDEMHSFYQTFDFLDLIKKWPEIVGPKFAADTSPLKIKPGTLFILSSHGAYSDALSYTSEMIKEKIFLLFPNLRPVIKKVSFQTQENFFKQKPSVDVQLTQAPQMHPQNPKYKLLKMEAERLFHDVEDPELKASLISIFIQSK